MLAASGHQVEGRVLEPCSETAGQAGLEVRSRRDVSPEERKEIVARPARGWGRVAARQAGLDSRVGGHEHHGTSVPGGCDSLYPGLCMALARVLAASAANDVFYAIFGIFVVAMIVLAVVVIVWAVRHDVAGRAAWRERQQERGYPPQPPGEGP